MPILHYYRRTPTPHSLLPKIIERLTQSFGAEYVTSLQIEVETELCFNVQIDSEEPLDATSTSRLEWLLRETFDGPHGLLLEESNLVLPDDTDVDIGDPHTEIMEFGPRMTFASAFSSNATSICAACGLDKISRLERSRRYCFTFMFPFGDEDEDLAEKEERGGDENEISLEDITNVLKAMLHDRMTEEEYFEPITSFESGATTNPVVHVPIMKEGRAALEKINEERGLGFDEFDLDFYTNLFKVSSTVCQSTPLPHHDHYFCFHFCSPASLQYPSSCLHI